MKTDEILKSLKFRSRADMWYMKDTWAELESNLHDFVRGERIEDGWGLFNGWTNELPYEGFSGLLPRWDGETCPYDEFDIFYEFENKEYLQVNRLTIDELKLIIMKRKKDKLFKEIAEAGIVSITWAMKNILGMTEEEIKIRMR
jgi:hypothetical protein